MKYVNVYTVTRHYGGPEEGGWWYNRFDLVDSYEADTMIKAHQFKVMAEKKYKDIPEGDIYSVLGGTELVVDIEDEWGASRTTARPHYE